MKRVHLILLVELFICSKSFSQGCIAGSSQCDAYMNNYHTRYLADADMFWDYSSGISRTYIPKNNNSSPIFAAGLWIGGYFQGSLRTAASTYRQNGLDFWPGPLDTTSAGTNAVGCSTYDNFFLISKTEVDNQKNHLYNSGNMPAHITNWPANPSSTGFSYKLAPYEDVNHNGKYDPLNGDYPIIWGDYSIYQIFNDAGNVHNESGSNGKFGFEIHATHYFVNCPNDSALWNTMFTHYDIINRSSNTYDSLHTAMWLDFNLGNYADDYIGCDTTLNLFYVYNGDGYDEDEGPYTGYHQYLPAFGGLILNEKLSSFTSYANLPPLNGSMGTPPVNSHSPYTYYSLTNGLFSNGNSIYIGGDGTTGAQTTKYLFSGDPVANTGWTEANATQLPGNKNGIGGTGPYTVNPGDTIKLDIAYVFARDYQHPNDSVASIAKLRQYVQSIKNYYDSNSTPCGSVFQPAGIKEENYKENIISIYPNPTKGDFIIETNNNEKQIVQIIDINGDRILSQEIYGKTSIEIPNLAAGVYTLSVINNTIVTNKKIVILK